MADRNSVNRDSPDSPLSSISFDGFSEDELELEAKKVELLKIFPSSSGNSNTSHEGQREPAVTPTYPKIKMEYYTGLSRLGQTPKAHVNANLTPKANPFRLEYYTLPKPNALDKSTNGLDSLDIKGTFEYSSSNELRLGPKRPRRKNKDLGNSAQTTHASEVISQEVSTGESRPSPPSQNQKNCSYCCSCKYDEELLEDLKLIKNQLILMVERVAMIEKCVLR